MKRACIQVFTKDHENWHASSMRQLKNNYLRMKNVLLVCAFLFSSFSQLSAQNSQIVFVTDPGTGVYSFWSVNDIPNSVPLELTDLINKKALQAGKNAGPFNVSHDGKWYSFQSERFDKDCDGWNCLTVADSSFKNIVSIRDGKGNVIHNESLAMVADGGKALVYASNDGPHSRDIFIVHKLGDSRWSIPKLLSANSTYDCNINPRFSFDGSRIVFQGGAAAFPGESILLVDSSGTNYSEKINRNATVNGIVGCNELTMPCFAPDGSIYFEGHWGGERVWHYPIGGITPVLPDANTNNDNSPVVLPNGKVASLLLPNITHDLKLMNSDGTAKFYMTGSTTSFLQNVEDVGIGAGLANPLITGFNTPTYDTANGLIVNLFPNPTPDKVTISSIEEITAVEVYNLLGVRVFTAKELPQHHVLEIDFSEFCKGIYLVKIYIGLKIFSDKIVKL